VENRFAELSFGEWLKRRRKAAGLTQQQLALQISCSTSALKKLEANVRRPSSQIVDQLSKFFNIRQEEQTAFLRFARGDWRSVPTEIKEDTPWRPSTKSPRSNLPASISLLVGREQAIADIRDYLSKEDIRLVTLIGPPGIGKTRLSIETARTELSKFPDGVFFVALAPLEDPSLIALTIVQALGFVETKNISVRQQLVDDIGGKQMLIVLDNCEHLIEDVAPLASDILSACPRLKILATSRESLRVPGEWLYRVPALDVPKQSSSIDVKTAPKFPALALFAERARAVQPGFTLNSENIQAVSSICAQLDGLPLAIELIAARIRLMSPAALLEHWNAQFILAADGVRAVTTRQKTLNNAIGWSYNLLSGEEQKLFAYLSVFSGGFTLEAAEAIFSQTITEKSVSDLITSLLDKSLLQQVVDERNRSRFTMLVTIQRFALNQLRSMELETTARHTHLSYFLELAEQAEPKLKSAQQFEWLDRLHIEQDNLRAAWDYAIKSNATLALRLASALLNFWFMRGNPSEGRNWCVQLLERTNHWGQTAKRAHVLGMAGRLTSFQQDFPTARPLLEQALAIARLSGDKQEIAFALLGLAAIALRQHDEKVAQAFAEECLMICQELQDEWAIAWAMFRLGNVLSYQGHHAEAEELFMKSLAKFQELGDKLRVVNIFNALGELMRVQGDYERASKFYEDSIEFLREHHSRSALAASLFNLAWVSLHRNNTSKARALFEESLKLYKQDSNKNAMIDCVAGLAAVLGTIGKPKQAAQLFGAVEFLLGGIAGHMEPPDQKEFDHYTAAVRSQLDEASFANAWEQGPAMTLEQAITYVLEQTENALTECDSN
jgi:predicted ATPase/Tfp pilus assembly protein PilF/DNA-binding XRE family transcriptional regulator